MDDSSSPHNRPSVQNAGCEIYSLPTIERPPMPSSGGRFFDSAGELASILNGKTIRFAAYIEFLPGGRARGNHVHQRKTEWLYIVSGKLKAAYVNTVTGDRSDAILRAGDLVIVYPNCAHVYQPIGDRAQAIELASHEYDPGDTVRYPIELLY